MFQIFGNLDIWYHEMYINNNDLIIDIKEGEEEAHVLRVFGPGDRQGEFSPKLGIM